MNLLNRIGYKLMALLAASLSPQQHCLTASEVGRYQLTSKTHEMTTPQGDIPMVPYLHSLLTPQKGVTVTPLFFTVINVGAQILGTMKNTMSDRHIVQKTSTSYSKPITFSVASMFSWNGRNA